MILFSEEESTDSQHLWSSAPFYNDNFACVWRSNQYLQITVACHTFTRDGTLPQCSVPFHFFRSSLGIKKFPFMYLCGPSKRNTNNRFSDAAYSREIIMIHGSFCFSDQQNIRVFFVTTFDMLYFSLYHVSLILARSSRQNSQFLTFIDPPPRFFN